MSNNFFINRKISFNAERGIISKKVSSSHSSTSFLLVATAFQVNMWSVSCLMDILQKKIDYLLILESNEHIMKHIYTTYRIFVAKCPPKVLFMCAHSLNFIGDSHFSINRVNTRLSLIFKRGNNCRLALNRSRRKQHNTAQCHKAFHKSTSGIEEREKKEAINWTIFNLN